MQAAVMEDSAGNNFRMKSIHKRNPQLSLVLSVNNNNMSAIDAAGPAYSYDALFPALPESFPSFMSNSASNNIIRVESSVVTQVKKKFF